MKNIPTTSSTSRFRQTIFAFDFYGRKPAFNYKGAQSSISHCGCCLSYATICIVIYLYYLFGQDLIFREKPKTLQYDRFIPSPDPIELGPNTFNVAFGLQHPDTFVHYINDKIYTLSAEMSFLRRVLQPDGSYSFSVSSLPIALERCNLGHFGQYQDKLKTLALNDLFCFSKNQPNLTNITILGKFEATEMNWVRIKFKECNTTEASCESQAIRDQYLKGGYFATYYLDINVELKDFKNPKKLYQDAIFTTFTKDYFKEYRMYVQHLELTSDSGWGLTREITQNQYRFGKLSENIDFRGGSSFFEFQIRVDPIKRYYERSYIKIQDVIASVDGVMTVVILIFYVSSRTFMKLKFYVDIMNDVFDVGSYKPHNNKISRKIGLSKKKKQKPQIKNKISNMDEIESHACTINIVNNEQQGLGCQSVTVQKNEGINEIKKENNILEPCCTTDRKEIITNPIITPRDEIQSSRREHLPQLSSRSTEFMMKFASPQLSPKLNSMEPTDQFTPNEKELFTSMLSDPSTSEIKSPYAETELQDSKGSSPREIDLKADDQILTDYFEVNANNQLNQSIRGRTSILRKASLNRMQDSELQYIRNGESKHKRVSLDAGDPSQHNFEGQIKPPATVNQPRQFPSMNYEPSNNFKQRHSIQKKNPQNPFSKIYKSHTTHNDDSDEEEDEAEEDPFKITIFEYLRSFFTRDSFVKEKNEFLSSGIKKIESRLDIFNVFKKLREVEKIKALIFDKDQLLLFDNLPKPILDPQADQYLNERENVTEAMLQKGSVVFESRKINLLEKTFTKLSKKYEKTDMDKKLLKLFENRFD